MEQGPKPEKRLGTEQLTPLEHLPAELGFDETEQMNRVRQEMVQALKSDNWPQILNLKRQYNALGDTAIEGMELEARKDASLGLTIAIALIMKEGGKIDNYGADLLNAHLIAWNRGQDELASLLEQAVNETGRQTLTSVPATPKKTKKEFDAAYKSELQQLAAELEAQAPPVEVSLNQNHLLVNGNSLGFDDGPAVLWAALNFGRQAIMEGLQNYRQALARPNISVSPNTPLRLVYLADYPRQVLTGEAMERVDYPHNEKYFDEIDDIKDEFKVLWKTVEVSGFVPEIRLFASQMGWDPVYLWATTRSA